MAGHRCGEVDVGALIMDDYTGFPLGTKFGPSVVEECPYCHRHGLAVKTTSGAKSYKHASRTSRDDDGTTFSEWDSCPKDHPPVKTPPHGAL